MRHPTTKLQSERLRLRRFRESDLETLHRFEGDPNIVRFTRLRFPKSKAESAERLKALIEKEEEREPFGVWAAELLPSGDVFSWLMLLANESGPPEIGFMTLPEFQGRGLTSEAIEMLTRHAFDELGVKEILALTDSANLVSQGLLKKIGFKEVRTFLSPDARLEQMIETKEFRMSN